jgi:hypothetical protein
MFSLEEIFDQAFTDNKSVKRIENGYQCVMLLDVKILKDDYTHEIDLLNTSKRYYKRLTDYESDTFKEKGWRYGVYVVTLANYRSKLDKVEKSIRDEVNGKGSEKTIKQLKATRDSLMSSYTQLNNKLNEQTEL